MKGILSLNFREAYSNRLAAFIVVLGCLSYQIQLANSCYITNCPWGGKRSIDDKKLMTDGDSDTRQCNACAGGRGTCFGPLICCGEGIGCLMDSKESLPCRMEDLKSTTPCVPYGKTCNKLEFGKCATKHLCCNPSSCVPDPNCDDISDYDEDMSLSSRNQRNSANENQKLIKILSYLLRKKQQQKNNNYDLIGTD